MMPRAILPAQFKDMEPLAQEWCIASERERNRKRLLSPIDQLQAVYDMLLPRMDEILSYLNRFRLEPMLPEVEALFLLALTMAEIAPAVEQFRSPSVPDTFGHERLAFGHSKITGLNPLAKNQWPDS
jgi:hypothetical protein